MNKSPRSNNVHILMTNDEAENLQSLANALRVSMGHVVRAAVSNFFQMHACEIPTCANGQRCFVPQMHGQPPNKP
jgi:hypothetical protein